MKTAFHRASSRFLNYILASSLALALWLCNLEATAANIESSTKTNAASPDRVRQPAVAGLFYPRDAQQLAKDLDRYLASAPTNVPTKVQPTNTPAPSATFTVV